MQEVRWHGRAQQGMVTAAKVLGETALSGGLHVQAFPDYGPERMGAPVKAFNRISRDEIRVHCQVTNPEYIIIADPTLIGIAGVTDGTSETALFIVNSSLDPSVLRTSLGLDDSGAKVYTVDASHISTEELGRHIPNTTLLGALSKVSDILDFDMLTKGFTENYSKKFSAKIIDGNIRAMTRGFEEVRGDR